MTSPTDPTILVIGSVNLDLMLKVDLHPRPGETVPGTSARRSPGGKGANQALAAARIGGRVRFAGRVGRDDEADQALELLRADDVDLTLTAADEGETTGLAVVTVDRTGENSIVVVPGANGTWTEDQVGGLTEAIDSSAVVVAQGEIPAPVVDAIAARCRHAGTRFLLNLAPVIDVHESTLLAADPLVVNEREARLVSTRLGVDPDAHDDESLVRALRDAGISSVVMTRGGDGAIAAAPQGHAHVPSPKVAVRDTTGAGDAFVGALAFALARGDDLESALDLAVRVGAAAVTGEGAQHAYPRAGQDLPRRA